MRDGKWCAGTDAVASGREDKVNVTLGGVIGGGGDGDVFVARYGDTTEQGGQKVDAEGVVLSHISV